MQSQYKMSMMGELTYFLGLQVKQSEKGILISQGKYVREMLKKFELTTCSEMKTPMAPPLKLDKDSNGKSVDITLYRGICCILQRAVLISCMLHVSMHDIKLIPRSPILLVQWF